MTRMLRYRTYVGSFAVLMSGEGAWAQLEIASPNKAVTAAFRRGNCPVTNSPALFMVANDEVLDSSVSVLP